MRGPFHAAAAVHTVNLRPVFPTLFALYRWPRRFISSSHFDLFYSWPFLPDTLLAISLSAQTASISEQV